MGIGSQLYGDDAAGVVLARSLLESGIEQPRLMVISAGMAPENFTGLLRLFTPDLVLLVDAAQMDMEPGTVCLLDFQSIQGCSASTHILPLHMFATYLIAELGCEPVLIGIQPVDTSMGSSLSTPVQVAIDTLVIELTESFQLSYAPQREVEKLTNC
jgi:hydrogenase 3 maturation protease